MASIRRLLPNGKTARRSPIFQLGQRSHARLFCRLRKTVIVAFRKYALLPLDDCLYALQPAIPNLTRSSLYCSLQRHDIGRLPDVEGSLLKFFTLN
jgi:hypothetical protein